MIDQLEQRIQGGYEAQEVLSSPAYVSAYSSIEQEFISAWIYSPARDAEGREKLYLSIRMLRKVQGRIEAQMTDSKMAQSELDSRNMAQKAVDKLRDWASF